MITSFEIFENWKEIIKKDKFFFIWWRLWDYYHSEGWERLIRSPRYTSEITKFNKFKSLGDIKTFHRQFPILKLNMEEELQEGFKEVINKNLIGRKVIFFDKEKHIHGGVVKKVLYSFYKKEATGDYGLEVEIKFKTLSLGHTVSEVSPFIIEDHEALTPEFVRMVKTIESKGDSVKFDL